MSDITYLTAEIVASAAANEHSRMRPEELVDLIKSVRTALQDAPEESSAAATEAAPKMSKREWSKLITGPKIKSLIDGKLYSSLKRHLSRHGHDAKSYRAAFGLPDDFPMVAPDYSASRSAMARELGLGGGRKRAKAVPAAAPAKGRRKAS